MTARFTKTIIATFAAALIGLSTGPAMAGGQFAIGYAPADPAEAQALGLGLQVFSIVRGLSATGATGYQDGNGNAAGFNQNGFGNHGLIWQEGDGHSGTINQNGDNNSCGLFQFGHATDAECVQNGSDLSGITTVFGF